MMKKPKLIYQYYDYILRESGVKVHGLDIRKPNDYNDTPKYFWSFADQLFTIEGQSNVVDEYHEHKYHTKGLREAYAISVKNLRLGHTDAWEFVRKLKLHDINEDGGFKLIVKRLRKMGAVRYAVGKVHDPARGVGATEFMPRKFTGKLGKKSVAYWDAINAGIEVQP